MRSTLEKKYRRDLQCEALWSAVCRPPLSNTAFMRRPVSRVRFGHATGDAVIGDWDGKSGFPEAATAFFKPHMIGADDFIGDVDELLRQFIPDNPIPPVNIDQAAKLKLLVDFYFALALEREARRRADSGKPPDEAERAQQGSPGS